MRLRYTGEKYTGKPRDIVITDPTENILRTPYAEARQTTCETSESTKAYGEVMLTRLITPSPIRLSRDRKAPAGRPMQPYTALDLGEATLLRKMHRCSRRTQTP